MSATNAAEDTAKLEKPTEAVNGDWTNLPQTHPLQQFSLALGGPDGILATAGHNEMYGVELVAATEE